MTLPVINAAKEVVIVAAGEGKVRGFRLFGGSIDCDLFVDLV